MFYYFSKNLRLKGDNLRKYGCDTKGDNNIDVLLNLD